MQCFKKSLWLSIVAAVALACSGKDDEPSTSDNTKDRHEILIHWADNIIVPSYDDFEEAFDALAVQTESFTASPSDATLNELRTSWVNAYKTWQRVELFEFGPADKYTLRSFFNIYPTDVSGIVSNMNDPNANLDLSASFAQQGFPALDYLINGVADDDAGIVAAYTSDAEAGKRIAYLKRIVARMQTLLSKVTTEWNGPYRDTFINKTSLDIGSSTGLVINAYVLHYERYIRSGKIGIPSGTAIGTTGGPFPERVEGYYKQDISRDLAIIAHQAARDFFNGKHVVTGEVGPSFKSYLDALGSKDAGTNKLLSDIINDQFDIIHTELNELSPNLYEQIQTENAEMQETYSAMQKLVRLLKVDMTSAVSVTITYTDNDGD